jgi:hypothetical protein
MCHAARSPPCAPSLPTPAAPSPPSRKSSSPRRQRNLAISDHLFRQPSHPALAAPRITSTLIGVPLVTFTNACDSGVSHADEYQVLLSLAAVTITDRPAPGAPPRLSQPTKRVARISAKLQLPLGSDPRPDPRRAAARVLHAADSVSALESSSHSVVVTSCLVNVWSMSMFVFGLLPREIYEERTRCIPAFFVFKKL